MKTNFDKCYHSLPTKAAEKVIWQQLHGSSFGLALAHILQHKNPYIVITPNIATANKLEKELKFFIKDQSIPIYNFPDWETLPYDHFSPHQDIISQRLWTLAKLPYLNHGILLTSITSLMHRLAPREFLLANSFTLESNAEFCIDTFRENLVKNGYRSVSKVIEHGEFAVRGSIIDVFPMGSTTPFRIDSLDNKIDSIRTFDCETQRSLKKVKNIYLLPAKEYPQTPEAIKHFRQIWRNTFTGDPTDAPIYENISRGAAFPGAEYYLKLFFANTASLFDYIPTNSTIFYWSTLEKNATEFWQELSNRFEQLRYNRLQPILPPIEVFIPVNEVFLLLNKFPQVVLKASNETKKSNAINFNTIQLPDIRIENASKTPLAKLVFLLKNATQVLFCCESLGRRENLLELLKTINIYPTIFDSWHDFLDSKEKVGITIGPIEEGLCLTNANHALNITLIAETQLFDDQVLQRRMRTHEKLDTQAIIRDLTELQIGAPVVHIEHGVGRYLGLQTLTTDNQPTEFLTIEYADNAKLYVPVASLHLISRYTGMDSEHAPLHRLGSKQWEKAKREAHTKIHDIAAELLKIYALRNNAKGFEYKMPTADYQAFAANFLFETTPDQEQAINDVIKDMVSPKPMDRLICGDVGFGKTEVAMRAAFLAVYNHKQVAVLTPTTILAEQHYNSFQDRFANWPIKIEMLSRFRTAKEQKKIFDQLTKGKIDIIIGTHKLLSSNVHFKNIGLLIIDEEHRFGVKQKEHIKKLGPNIDILTLTATPIPRTLNMAFASIRDFSIIATPPAKRLSIKTFIHENNLFIVREAILRETLRGGQVFFLHNNVASIAKAANDLHKLVPEAKICVAHGQMRELQLEQIMRDFYHLRYNVLVCTTIIESGIDIPTANTIIIDRADCLGLAQLHQLRGRVGRSHHQAYAYFLTPPQKLLTPDAKKRLDAIAAMEDLGAGFCLATHDLEIRGAGELLGEDQSGQIQNIGFSLYMEFLGKATVALKNNKDFSIDSMLQEEIEIDLHIPALIPDTYLDDVSMRLVLYKRIANAKDKMMLSDLEAEMLDRFGPLPEAAKNLFKITALKLNAKALGIHKILIGSAKGRIEFLSTTTIDPQTIIDLIQKKSTSYKMRGPNNLEFAINSQDAQQKINFVNNLLQAFKTNT
jgi:transcription-repair coupling factor (superfamily II helicase)